MNQQGWQQGWQQGPQPGYPQPGYPPQFSRRQESSGSGVTIAIVIVLLLLLVLGGGAVIFLMSSSDDKAAADKAAAAKAAADKAAAQRAATQRAATQQGDNPPEDRSAIDRDDNSLPSPNYESDVPSLPPVGDPIDKYVGNYNNNGAWIIKTTPNSGLVITNDKRRSPAVVQSNGDLKTSFIGDSNCCTQKLVGNELKQFALDGTSRGTWTKTGTDTSMAPAAPTVVFPGFPSSTSSQTYISNPWTTHPNSWMQGPPAGGLDQYHSGSVEQCKTKCASMADCKSFCHKDTGCYLRGTGAGKVGAGAWTCAVRN